MDIVQSGLQGLARAESAVDRSANRIARGSLPEVGGQPQDTVDLSAEMVALIEAKNAFQSNVKSVETGQEIAKSTIDLLG